MPSLPNDLPPGDDATSVMSRPQIEARVRQVQQGQPQQPPVSRGVARPPVDLVPHSQRAGNERTAVLPNKPPIPRAPNPTGNFSRPPPVPPTERTRPPVGPESVGAIALPRPPVQPPNSGNTSGMSRPPAPRTPSQVGQPPGTIRQTGPIRKTGSLPPQPQPSRMPSLPDAPSLDDLVPRTRSQHPRPDRPLSTRPPASHRSAPPPGRPRFIDRTPEPRSVLERQPGQGLPGPDSFGRLPAPQRYEAQPSFPPPAAFPSPSQFPAPDETVAMARGNPATAFGGPRQHEDSLRERSLAPQPPVVEYYQQPPPQQQQQRRDPNEYYPHLSQPPPPASRGPGYDHSYSPQYPPQQQHQMQMQMQQAPVNVHGRTMPASHIPLRLPTGTPIQPIPGTAPYPAMAEPIEAPSFMALILFAAPLALATLAVAALALM